MIKLDSKQNKLLQKTAAKFQLKFIIVFGSYTEGKQSPDSDLDVVVYSRDPRALKFSVLGELFSSLSEVFLGYNLDLSILNTANPLFRYEVIRKGQLLFGDELEYLEFKSFAFRDYIDSASLRNLESRLILKRQKALKELLK